MSKPSLLFVSPVIPDFTGGGTPMRAASQIMVLAGKYDVTLAIAAYSVGGGAVPAELRKACAAVLVVERTTRVERRFRLVRNVQARLVLEALWPFPRLMFETGPALAALAKELAGRQFDVVHCLRLKTARFVRRLGPEKIAAKRSVLDFDDYESHARFRAVKPFAALMGKQLAAVYWLEAAKWAAQESQLIPRFDDVLVCAEEDQAKLRRRFPRNRWHVVPNTVAEPAQSSVVEHDRFTFLFVGQLNYTPNTDAVIFFCTRVLPILQRLVPSPFRVLIVGRSPREAPRLADLRGIEIIGDPPDVAPYYAEADVAIVPLRAGGGTRIKILEAFSHGLPVISTIIGAEGLAVTPGADILIADDPQSFAEACLRLWTDDLLRRRIAAAGRDLWRRRYNPAILTGTLAAIYQGGGAGGTGEPHVPAP